MTSPHELPRRKAGLGFPGPDGREAALAAGLRTRIGEQLAAYHQSIEEAGLPTPTPEERRDAVRRLLATELDHDAEESLAIGRPTLTQDAEERISRSVMDGLFGLGPLEQLLSDDAVENIFINGTDSTFVRYVGGRKDRIPPLTTSDGELVELLRTVAARAGNEERRFDRGAPSLSVQLSDGSRLFAVMAVSGRVSVSIRRHRIPTATLKRMREMGVCDDAVADLLGALVRARKNVIIAGGTNTGKTTMLRALASEIPTDERIITIEDTYELGLDKDPVAHPDVVALQAREPNVEGLGAVDQAELVRWGLRMAPDRVIVGEIRGPEVIPMANAMSQGNDGSLSTIHSSTSRGVFTKLGAYAAQSPERLSMEATSLLIASAVHFVVHLTWSTDGRRVVGSVREIVDTDGRDVISNELYRPGPDRRAQPATPVRAETLDELFAAGLDEDLQRETWWRGA